MSRWILSAAIMLVVTPSHVCIASRAVESGLTLSVSIPRRGPERRVHLRDPNSHFHVVVTNSSEQDMRLWETWNSWGYFNLRFDVLDHTGAVVYQIRRSNNKNWTRNFPSWITLRPGEHYVMDVSLDRNQWELPFLKEPGAKGRFQLRMRAVFENSEDEETRKHNVWTGRVQSRVDDFRIEYWRD